MCIIPLFKLCINFCKALSRKILTENSYRRQLDGVTLEDAEYVDIKLDIFAYSLQELFSHSLDNQWSWKTKQNTFMKLLKWDSYNQTALSFGLLLTSEFLTEEEKGVKGPLSLLCSLRHPLFGDKSKSTIYFTIVILKFISL